MHVHGATINPISMIIYSLVLNHCMKRYGFLDIPSYEIMEVVIKVIMDELVAVLVVVEVETVVTLLVRAVVLSVLVAVNVIILVVLALVAVVIVVVIVDMVLEVKGVMVATKMVVKEDKEVAVEEIFVE